MKDFQQISLNHMSNLLFLTDYQLYIYLLNLMGTQGSPRDLVDNKSSKKMLHNKVYFLTIFLFTDGKLIMPMIRQ